MSSFFPRLAPLGCALWLLFSGSLYAANAPTANKIYQPSRQSHTNINSMEELAYRQKIVQHTAQTFTLLSAEIALKQGDISYALSAYLDILRKTGNSDVAERAMDIAIQNKAYNVAALVYQIWQGMATEPSAAQRRITWVRALALNDIPTALTQLDNVLAEANDEQRARLFMTIGQMALVNNELIQQGENTVHRAALRYNTLPEAAIADIFFSIQNKSHMVNALKRLSQLDPDVSTETLATLNLVANNRPQFLNAFFHETRSEKLSSTWRQLEIESLIAEQKYTQAEQKIQKFLQQNEPNAAIYFQAARLAKPQTPDDNTAFIQYQEKAYTTGIGDEKSIAAFYLATEFTETKQYDKAVQWAQKISDEPQWTLDKTVLLSGLAAEQKNWTQAMHLTRNVFNQDWHDGHFFTPYALFNNHLVALRHNLSPEQALAHLTRLIQQTEKKPKQALFDSKLASLLYQRSLLYVDALNQPQRAVTDLRRYMRMNPNSPAGQNTLGYILLGLGKEHYEEALKLIQAAHAQMPDDAAIMDSLGWAYYKIGDMSQAVFWLEKAHQKDPNPELSAHLGEVYWQTKNQESARRIWHEAWQKEPSHTVLQDTLKRFGVQF